MKNLIEDLRLSKSVKKDESADSFQKKARLQF